MRKRLAPSHDLCARMRYVPADDTAWKRDLITDETTAIELKFGAAQRERGHALPDETRFDPAKGHPYWVYFAGATRFDLDDPALAPYFDRDAQPETWRFRRLSIEERSQVSYLERLGRQEEAWRLAFMLGVVGFDNPATPEGVALAALLQSGERTDTHRAAILKAAENYAASAVDEVGAACFRGSQDLTAQEKKA